MADLLEGNLPHDLTRHLLQPCVERGRSIPVFFGTTRCKSGYRPSWGSYIFLQSILVPNVFYISEYVLWLNAGLVPFCGDPIGHNYFVRHRKVLGLLCFGEPLKEHGPWLIKL